MAKATTKTLEDVYMTAKEVRELFHVSQKTVCRWREKGLLKGGVKVGLEYRYPTSEVMALLRKREADEVENIISAKQEKK